MKKLFLIFSIFLSFFLVENVHALTEDEIIDLLESQAGVSDYEERIITVNDSFVYLYSFTLQENFKPYKGSLYGTPCYRLTSNIDDTLSASVYFYKISDGTIKQSTTSLNAITNFSDVKYSTLDIYTNNIYVDIEFAKNYVVTGPIEPEPTPTPPDISELEECDSIVCDISDNILQNVEFLDFPFVSIILEFLIIMLINFTILSPLLVVLFLLRRWF